MQVIAHDAADGIAAGDGAAGLGGACADGPGLIGLVVIGLALGVLAADVQARNAAHIVLVGAAHAAGEGAVRDQALVQAHHAAHGSLAIHHAGVAAVVDDVVQAAHAHDAADNGHAQRVLVVLLQLCAQGLRGVVITLCFEIVYQVHAVFQLAAGEGIRRRLVKRPLVQTVFQEQLAVALAVTNDAAGIGIGADGHVVAGVFQMLCIVVCTADGQGMTILGRNILCRHVSVVRIHAGQQGGQAIRSPVGLSSGIGPLVADETAAEGLRRDGAQAVVHGQAGQLGILR